ncbi:MAG: Unknown protein [uncultured Sulfurovum sp.]|uniref:N-acetyltransferase domain-containing protein n=1 Tax=uncultured Sulfurovum sp. TaxID=269237 RepID=A0A6S6SXY8_9BACT|nr:MAG: Unknown protein [uncultured Sulfurovum sp.]
MIEQSSTKFYQITNHNNGEIMLGLQIKKKYRFNHYKEVDFFEMDMHPFIISAPGALKHLYSVKHDTWTLKLSRTGTSTYNPFCSSIYLHPDLHGLGIGTMFMNLMIEEGKILFKDHAIALDLPYYSENRTQRLKKFYESFGFKIIKEGSYGWHKGYSDSFSVLNTVDEVKGIEEKEGATLIISQSGAIEAYQLQTYDDKNVIKNLKEMIKYYRNLSDRYYLRLKWCFMAITIVLVLPYIFYVSIK